MRHPYPYLFQAIIMLPTGFSEGVPFRPPLVYVRFTYVPTPLPHGSYRSLPDFSNADKLIWHLPNSARTPRVHVVCFSQPVFSVSLAHCCIQIQAPRALGTAFKCTSSREAFRSGSAVLPSTYSCMPTLIMSLYIYMKGGAYIDAHAERKRHLFSLRNQHCNDPNMLCTESKTRKVSNIHYPTVR